MNTALSSPFSTPAYARLREQIRADIVAGIWKLGQHITMAELSSRYGVSGNPVREALHQLQGDGLVEMRQNRGAVVCKVDASFVKNVYDVRGAIEGMLAAEAARLATKDDVARIEGFVSAYETAVAAKEIEAIVKANRALHRAINCIAQNPLALDIFDGRSSLIDALRRTLGNRSGRLDEIIAEHRKIFEAIASGDALTAGHLAQQHTMRARDHMLENIRDAVVSTT
ncbi:GntR family transcriptional regulator [Pararhizobium sp. DWP3-4]|uniref:GntR family transcriptional regulator n=1 Tax=Pararhizobium sp. DWP3-4 TaxID=2804565 RepID=UPI003CEA4272